MFFDWQLFWPKRFTHLTRPWLILSGGPVPLCWRSVGLFLTSLETKTDLFFVTGWVKSRQKFWETSLWLLTCFHDQKDDLPTWIASLHIRWSHKTTQKQVQQNHVKITRRCFKFSLGARRQSARQALGPLQRRSQMKIKVTFFLSLDKTFLSLDKPSFQDDFCPVSEAKPDIWLSSCLLVKTLRTSHIKMAPSISSLESKILASGGVDGGNHLENSPTVDLRIKEYPMLADFTRFAVERVTEIPPDLSQTPSESLGWSVWFVFVWNDLKFQHITTNYFQQHVAFPIFVFFLSESGGLLRGLLGKLLRSHSVWRVPAAANSGICAFRGGEETGKVSPSPSDVRRRSAVPSSHGALHVVLLNRRLGMAKVMATRIMINTMFGILVSVLFSTKVTKVDKRRWFSSSAFGIDKPPVPKRGNRSKIIGIWGLRLYDC